MVHLHASEPDHISRRQGLDDWEGDHMESRLSDLPLLPGLTWNGDRRPGRSHREAAARSSSRCLRWRS